MLQLTPEGIDLFDAAVADHPEIDYGCVVAGVPKPREDRHLSELLDPEYVALRTLFRLLHGLTARPHPHWPYPRPTQASRPRPSWPPSLTSPVAFRTVRQRDRHGGAR
ncbi:MAG: hypothetical protein IH627_05720 [Rubrivivax sp.]|nr:hypothetical protein [Rubrivivax sp.]